MGIRISEMEEATTFGADDYVPIVTNGTNKKALGSKIKDFIAGFFATKTGDNISDKATFRSAIEISATNTPFDKTGTGMSAENVQAAIAELSGNRALIDGSNIANPSAFRSNIGCEWTSFANAISDPNSNIEDITLKKCNNVVYVSLTTNQKTFNENDVLFTITNSALIPTNNQRLVCWSYAPDKCYTISIKTNGVVDCYGRGSITGRLIFNGFYFTL